MYFSLLQEFKNGCAREEIIRSDSQEMRGMSPQLRVTETKGSMERMVPTANGHIGGLPARCSVCEGLTNYRTPDCSFDDVQSGRLLAYGCVCG